MKVKRLAPEAKLPVKAHIDDLGYDLFSVESMPIFPGMTTLVRTGIAIEFPTGYGGIIKDRSSMARVGLVTHAGVIDSGYRGEIQVLLHNVTSGTNFIGKGQKIAQLVLVPITDEQIVEVDELSTTVRNSAGFGSTGA